MAAAVIHHAAPPGRNVAGCLRQACAWRLPKITRAHTVRCISNVAPSCVYRFAVCWRNQTFRVLPRRSGAFLLRASGVSGGLVCWHYRFRTGYYFVTTFRLSARFGDALRAALVCVDVPVFSADGSNIEGAYIRFEALQSAMKAKGKASNGKSVNNRGALALAGAGAAASQRFAFRLHPAAAVSASRTAKRHALSRILPGTAADMRCWLLATWTSPWLLRAS